MITATLTTKGQITIPKTIRDSLHLHTGDKVAFVLNAGGETVLKPLTQTVDKVYGILHKPGGIRKTVEEMNTAIEKRSRMQSA